MIAASYIRLFVKARVLPFTMMVFLASVSFAEDVREISINGVELPSEDVEALDIEAGGYVENGKYWKDSETGAWGYEGNSKIEGYLRKLNQKELTEKTPIFKNNKKPIDKGVYDDGRYTAELEAPSFDRYTPLPRVDPALLKLAKQSPDSEIIFSIQLYRDDQDLAQKVIDTRSKFRAEMDLLISGLRKIDAAYAPQRSLSSAEEAEFIKYFKFSDNDIKKREAINAQVDKLRTKINREVIKHVSENKPGDEDVYALIEALGGTLLGSMVIDGIWTVRLPAKNLNNLLKETHISQFNFIPKYEANLSKSVPSVGINEWWDAGISGGIFDAVVVDTGIQTDHPNFSDINFRAHPEVSSVDDPHGTHVTGILSNNHRSKKGAARVGDLFWGTFNQGLPFENIINWSFIQEDDVADVANLSFSFTVDGDRDHVREEGVVDRMILYNNTLMVVSTSNRGWSDTESMLQAPARNFNGLSVASMDIRGTMDRSDDVRAWNSSVGPTPSFTPRRKPDITAPGHGIMSTNSDWAGLSPNFIEMAGTSMAAPHVAGAVLLMMNSGNLDTISQRAVLINTADTWTSNDTETSEDDGQIAGSRWDKSYGWGYLDMKEALFNRGDFFLDSVVPKNDTAEDDDYHLYSGLMFPGEKATLVWNWRSPRTGSRYLNDLNMRLYNEQTGELIDRDTDRNDNVHQVAMSGSVYVPVPVPTRVVAKVYSWSTSYDYIDEEAYALATEENFSEVSPPNIVYSFEAPGPVYPAREVTQVFDITNEGDVTAHNVRFILGDHPNLRGTGERVLTSLAPGETVSVTYTLSAKSKVQGIKRPNKKIMKEMSITIESESYAENYRVYDEKGYSLFNLF